ncbi:MAG: TIGR04255 family protein [Sulfitobacter sp.]
MAWRPVFEKHAIEKVRVIFAFNADFRPKFVHRLSEFLEQNRVVLGLNAKVDLSGPGLVIQIGTNGPAAPQNSQVAGWSYRRTLSDGTIVENISLENGVLSFESSQYTNWTAFVERVLLATEGIVAEMSTYDDMVALALEYYDRFIYVGEPKKADPLEIFDLDTKLIPAEALADGNMWHIHRGWFEASGGGKLLVNQNLDAQDGEFDRKPARSIAIMTKVEARNGMHELTPATVSDSLTVMHDRSKEVLKDVLLPKTVEMIGM